MNVRMTAGKQITLPDDVVEALQLEPGSEVVFERRPGGQIVITKAGEVSRPSKAEYRRRLQSLLGSAGPGPTTDEIMRMTRGED
jgi:bifunctional DNA-binding transcriptional regulator/antitoxin component of YhaV-PrlF toxin-antitoxin module